MHRLTPLRLTLALGLVVLTFAAGSAPVPLPTAEG